MHIAMLARNRCTCDQPARTFICRRGQYAHAPALVLRSSNPVYYFAERCRGATYSVDPVAIANVASNAWESHPAIDPRTGDLWFVRSDANFQGWALFVARCDGRRFQPAAAAPFAHNGLEADPFFSEDGRSLYFISTRSSGAMRSAALDIWRSERDTDGLWRAPEMLPAPINSDASEWFPRLASDGWLYFGSGRSGGLGGVDIWRARQSHGGEWSAENLGPFVNSAANEFEFTVSPDGKAALLATSEGLFQLTRRDGEWADKTRLGPEINVNGTEIGATFLGDGDHIIFSRDSGTSASGEFFVARKKGHGAIDRHFARRGTARCWPQAQAR